MSPGVLSLGVWTRGLSLLKPASGDKVALVARAEPKGYLALSLRSISSDFVALTLRRAHPGEYY